MKKDEIKTRENMATCSPEILKVGVAFKSCINMTENQSLDIKTANLQGDEIKRTVYLRSPTEAREDRFHPILLEEKRTTDWSNVFTCE